MTIRQVSATGHTIHSKQCYAGHYQVFFIKNNLFTFGYQLEVVVNSINCSEIMLRLKDDVRIVHTKNKQARLKDVRKVGIYQREI